jgi:protein-serine/threonine kinase
MGCQALYDLPGCLYSYGVLPGGDLMTMLIKYEIFSEHISRFYMAEIILAIDAVHQLGYIHR